jgi:hypothetical protein
MTTDNIQWTGDHDDFTARVDGYTLRAEKVGPGRWWWCCRNEAVHHWEDSYTDGVWPESADEAKAKAVGAMNGHKGKG